MKSWVMILWENEINRGVIREFRTLLGVVVVRYKNEQAEHFNENCRINRW